MIRETTAARAASMPIGADLVAEGMVTVKDAAAFLALSRPELYRLMDRGELPYMRQGRARRIPRVALRAFASSRLVGAA